MTRNELVEQNLGIARKVARNYADKCSRYTYDEYLSTAYEYLVIAANSFNEDRGVKFSTYATIACRNGIRTMYIRDRWYNGKNRKPLKQLHSSLNVNAEYGESNGEELIQILADNNLSEYDMLEVRELINLIANDMSKGKGRKNLDRNRKIIELRVFRDLQYKEIAEIFGITLQQVHKEIVKFKREALKYVVN